MMLLVAMFVVIGHEKISFVIILLLLVLVEIIGRYLISSLWSPLPTDHLQENFSILIPTSVNIKIQGKDQYSGSV